ncbi:16S rRNA (cytosine(1402)-N(4))-methyltransferase [Candidatus Nomurabacteria bacterium RIFCSPLOWO2_01_FULL_42_20]|uniref:Ribosomal RNA small subunit methyltransferase H n=1 Tax=Candidatus Nomurabacteria bacterium RIFCSPHIGHO2_01_FULL_42_16 TaxID=1801743 RepID=A0A1F6VJY6_9BACT|nr:MAG: 16S rRNA (cytosine(1402)-N(4))-methyltransferase [Candidatus Nomurabacteria bacterium RIFCSPHIGHO2_01_FULL_42_16]OGI92132.1 MAG: 16S rRNA (cytosine(1402)-N(4))-methyltransferase [Candidatus Nomurabacteria bacterium RIFCSPLOWO2_01_FULL_42_20]
MFMHKPVLLKESIEGLDIQPGDIFVDATLGDGGHTEYVCKLFGREVKVIGLDADSQAVKRAEENLKNFECEKNIKVKNFSDIDQVLAELGIERANRILADLGLSSYQLLESGRGFSFQRDEPLLMTMKRELEPEDVTAEMIVNVWSEETLADIIYGYGEERYARRIAKKIVTIRKVKPIKTTFDLVEIIRQAVPKSYQRRRLHYATRTFQAIRIAVNDELKRLETFLDKAFKILTPGGRIAVIAFHSLEDRIAKRFFREKQKEGLARVLTKKPIVPSPEEIKNNPRARSAKLRVLQKL